MSGEYSGKTPYIPADGDGGNNDKNNGGNNGGNNVLLSLRGIEKTYGDKRVLSDLSLDIYRGETLCILGESGGGKTTLLNILARLTSCDKGEVSFAPPERLQRGDNAADCILTERRGKKDRQDYPRVAYAFQDGRLLPNLTALENLTFAGGEKENCRALLKAAFLSDKEKKRPSALSGGEKQRLSLLRAFAAPFDLLLADEPFSALDIALKERMILLFRSLLSEKGKTGGKKTAVVVTHSVKEATAIGDRVAVLKNGRIETIPGVNANERNIERNNERVDRLRAILVSLMTQDD